MLWGKSNTYCENPFESESELEDAILETADALFGSTRIYLDIKRKIGQKGSTRNIPDGYLVDLSSTKEPRLYVVENELAEHEPLKHIAAQILEFSLSFETSPHLVKNIVKKALASNEAKWQKCQEYASANGFENIDFLLERMVFGKNRFNALVIIDELSEELEKVLISRFQFPVETLTLERYTDKSGQHLYRFDPFLSDVTAPISGPTDSPRLPPLDPSELDTIVVPAREEGFTETFLGGNRWYQIRIRSSMLSKIKYIAVYRVAPVSAITHIAPVSSIGHWQDSTKYVLDFAVPATEIGPIALVPKGSTKAPQASRYTSRARLEEARNLDEAF